MDPYSSRVIVIAIYHSRSMHSRLITSNFLAFLDIIIEVHKFWALQTPAPNPPQHIAARPREAHCAAMGTVLSESQYLSDVALSI